MPWRRAPTVQDGLPGLLALRGPCDTIIAFLRPQAKRALRATCRALRDAVDEAVEGVSVQVHGACHAAETLRMLQRAAGRGLQLRGLHLSPPSGTSPHQHHYPHHDAASAEALCSPGWAKISGKMGRFRLDKGTLTAQLGRALATNFRTLTVLQLHACTVPSLGLLPWRSLPSLNHLWLDDARLDLEQLPSLAAVSSLKRLTLKHCRQLEASSMLMLTEGAADRDDDEDDEFDVPGTLLAPLTQLEELWLEQPVTGDEALRDLQGLRTFGYVNPWAPPGTDVSWYTPETEALSAWTNLGWLCLRDSKLGLRELQALSALTGLTRLSCALLLGIVSAEDPGLPFDLNLELATIHNSTPPQQPPPQQALGVPLSQRFVEGSAGDSSNGNSMVMSRQATFESADGGEGGVGAGGNSNGQFPVSNSSTSGILTPPARGGLQHPSNGGAGGAGPSSGVAGAVGASTSAAGASLPPPPPPPGGTYGLVNWLQTSDDRSNNLSGIAAAQQSPTPASNPTTASLGVGAGSSAAAGAATPSSFSTPTRFGRSNISCSGVGKRQGMPCLPSVRVLEVHTATVHCLVTLDMPALEVLCSDMDSGAPLTLYLHKGDRYQAPVLHRCASGLLRHCAGLRLAAAHPDDEDVVVVSEEDGEGGSACIHHHHSGALPTATEVEDALAALAHWVPTEKAIQVASTRTLHPRRLGLVSLPVTRLALAQVQPGVQALDLWECILEPDALVPLAWLPTLKRVDLGERTAGISAMGVATLMTHAQQGSQLALRAPRSLLPDTAAEEACKLALAWRHGIAAAVPRVVREWSAMDEEAGGLVMPPPLAVLGVPPRPGQL